MLAKDAVVQGRYQVIGILGHGAHGQGNVYLVEVLSQPGRRLALKEMLVGEADAEALRRFEVEAAAWSGLKHRYLPAIQDFFVDQVAAYVAMDYVSGRTLWDVLASLPAPPPVSKAITWLQPMVEVLKAAHSRPLVWRELEPANCLVQPDGQLKLISFGLGRLFSQPEPNPFSAPEEEFGSQDPRSDIYSLGATVYCVLSRHLPPESWERATGRVRLPAAPGVSQPVMQVIEQMLAVLPEERFRTVAEAWEALQRAFTGVAPGASRPPPQLKWRPTQPTRPAPAPAPVEEEEEPEVDEETELRDYLNDVIKDYERYVRNIGKNGLTAPNVLYYRDEVQDTLEALDELKADTQPFWAYLVELDAELKDYAETLVNEIGWNNFKQYWIMNDPPPKRWWWYLSRQFSPPPPPPRFWEVWKKKPPTPPE